MKRTIIIFVIAALLIFSLTLWALNAKLFGNIQTRMHTHTLIGAGILGMAVIFFLSWLGIKTYGMRNG